MLTFPLKTWLSMLPLEEREDFKTFCYGKNYVEETPMTQDLFNRLRKKHQKKKKK